MILSLDLENFKGFKALKGLQFAPLTILCGTNSSGKSSVLQSMLTLKQTLESVRENQQFLLNGRFTQLGTYKDLVNNHDIKKNVLINTHIIYTGSNTWFSVTLDKLFDLKNKIELHNNKFFCNFKYTLESGKKQKNNEILNSASIKQIEFCINTIGANNVVEEVFYFRCKKISEYIYDYYMSSPEGDYIQGPFKKWINKKGVSFRQNSDIENMFPMLNFTRKQYEDIEEDRRNGKKTKNIFINDLNYSLFYHIRNIPKNVFRNIRYIGPLREKPTRRYIYENEVSEIGAKGENAAYIYQEEENKKIKNYYLLEDENFVMNKVETNLSTLTRKVLNSMNISNISSTTEDSITKINLNSFPSSTTKVSIADVGFGVSQVFPIVLEGLRMDREDLLMLEQPEIHLHPNLQMQMADFFIGLALSGKNLLIETHSDHIINRLVRRIVEDNDYLLSDLIKIYFVKSTDEGPLFESIEINPEQGIVNWPKDFFDQTASEQEKIIKAGIKKRKANKQKKENAG